ncbi:hypothetical protein [Nocardioides jishulii]|uniref:hypothetical protein n=1 Tax=Nocardioides jishulii TaxID=2575440 RepID=UPI0014852DFD|nr:hypothetical protein [Nocardioides jishulii]
MYFDQQECRVCGAQVKVRPHDGEPPREGKDPDGTVDVRVCTDPECPSNRGTDAAPRP